MFVEAKFESLEVAPPVRQTAAMAEIPKATVPVSEAHPASADSETPALPNQGTVLVDATCASADVANPTDLNLLNETREKLEAIIDTLHEPVYAKRRNRVPTGKGKLSFFQIGKQSIDVVSIIDKPL